MPLFKRKQFLEWRFLCWQTIFCFFFFFYSMNCNFEVLAKKSSRKFWKKLNQRYQNLIEKFNFIEKFVLLLIWRKLARMEVDTNQFKLIFPLTVVSGFKDFTFRYELTFNCFKLNEVSFWQICFISIITILKLFFMLPILIILQYMAKKYQCTNISLTFKESSAVAQKSSNIMSLYDCV